MLLPNLPVALDKARTEKLSSDGGGASSNVHSRASSDVYTHRTLPGFPDARRVKPKTPKMHGKRARWKDSRGRIYEWDYQHGAVEVYDSLGRHLGQFDPDTGDQQKPADPSRRVEP
ncbi:MAG: colicin E3/pyocin S6 family cytotoxin [Solirubrobacteraceae bacterium]